MLLGTQNNVVGPELTSYLFISGWSRVYKMASATDQNITYFSRQYYRHTFISWIHKWF